MSHRHAEEFTESGLRDHLVQAHGGLPTSLRGEGWAVLVTLHDSAHGTDEDHRDDAAYNHPAHYGGADNPHEAIKCIHAHGLDFDLGNAVKYIFRAGKKDATKVVEDLRKAIWYIESEIALVQEQS